MRRIHDGIDCVEILFYQHRPFQKPPRGGTTLEPDIPIFVPKSVAANTLTLSSFVTFPTISTACPTCRWLSCFPRTRRQRSAPSCPARLPIPRAGATYTMEDNLHDPIGVNGGLLAAQLGDFANEADGLAREALEVVCADAGG